MGNEKCLWTPLDPLRTVWINPPPPPEWPPSLSRLSTFWLSWTQRFTRLAGKPKQRISWRAGSLDACGTLWEPVRSRMERLKTYIRKTTTTVCLVCLPWLENLPCQHLEPRHNGRHTITSNNLIDWWKWILLTISDKKTLIDWFHWNLEAQHWLQAKMPICRISLSSQDLCCTAVFQQNFMRKALSLHHTPSTDNVNEKPQVL